MMFATTVQCAEKQIRIPMLPPPCFSMGMVFFFFREPYLTELTDLNLFHLTKELLLLLLSAHPEIPFLCDFLKFLSACCAHEYPQNQLPFYNSETLSPELNPRY